MQGRDARRYADGSGRSLVLSLFFLSGACDLVCEIAWSRALEPVFGVTVFAVGAVLAAFMLGLATGGLLVTRLARWTSQPMSLFSRLHLGISLSTAAPLLLIPAVRALYIAASRSFGPASWAVRPAVIVLSVAFMIVPTALMGATFPVACQVLVPRTETVGRDVGSLYAAGTAGSVLGCILAVSILLPAAGLRDTIVIIALVELTIALVASSASRASARK